MSKTDKGAAGADQSNSDADRKNGVDDGAPPAPPAPLAADSALKEGAEVILSAVHGLLIHPHVTPEIRFDQGALTKVVVDRWVIGQFEAGKLRRA